MNEKSLEFNLTIKTEPQTDEIVEIAGLDIDFDIIKTNTAENNKAILTIWNLDNTKFQCLTEKDDPVCLYASYGEDEPSLVFRGCINKFFRKNDGIGADIPAVIELVDGKKAYTTAVINKNYREKVSSTLIINDCINAMGLSIGIFSQDLPEKIYYGYKAAGFAHVILRKICTPLNIKFSIQNGVINLISANTKPQEETALILNDENSSRPRSFKSDEIVIPTGFIPYINPNGSVKCEFDNFSCLRLIKRVHSFGNNYGKAVITEITV